MELRLQCGITFELWNYEYNMGLGANEEGHCSGCDSDHLRPWGTQCLAYKEALQRCTDFNLDQSTYKQYLDLNLVKRAKDLPGYDASNITGGTAVEQHGSPEDKDDKLLEQVKRLTDINLKQKAQIQSLVHKLKEAQSPPRLDQGPLLQQIIDRLDRLENTQPVRQSSVLAGSSAVNARQSSPVQSTPQQWRLWAKWPMPWLSCHFPSTLLVPNNQVSYSGLSIITVS